MIDSFPGRTRRDGRLSAGAGLSRAHRAELVRVAVAFLGSREEAEDVVQEALLRYVDRTTPAPDSPRAWLFRVTRNLAIDRLRRLRLERGTPLHLLEIGAVTDEGSTAPDDTLTRRERCRAAIRALLAVADPRDAATVLLREVFGTGYGDIARASGRGEAACRQVVHRTLARARERRGGLVRDAADDAAESSSADASSADALARFEHAVLHAQPTPLFDALRVSADGAGVPSGGIRHASRAGAAQLRLDVDAGGARVSLVLRGTVLCTLPARGAAWPCPRHGRRGDVRHPGIESPWAATS